MLAVYAEPHHSRCCKCNLDSPRQCGAEGTQGNVFPDTVTNHCFPHSLTSRVGGASQDHKHRSRVGDSCVCPVLVYEQKMSLASLTASAFCTSCHTLLPRWDSYTMYQARTKSTVSGTLALLNRSEAVSDLHNAQELRLSTPGLFAHSIMNVHCCSISQV